MTANDNIILREVVFGSGLYDLTKQFREKILRTPLGQVLSTEDLKGEDSQFHFAAIKDGKDILGTVVLKPVTPEVMKLRQMAVSEETAGMGLGRRLVTLAEEFAQKNGYHLIEMTARCSAQGFYEKLGYSTRGDVFMDTAVPVSSIIMERKLSS